MKDTGGTILTHVGLQFVYVHLQCCDCLNLPITFFKKAAAVSLLVAEIFFIPSGDCTLMIYNPKKNPFDCLTRDQTTGITYRVSRKVSIFSRLIL